jgi:uncharacterized protein YcgI (DUF1989 family)
MGLAPETPVSEKLSLGQILSIINLEGDYAARVMRAYYLAQDLLRESLGISPETNETHREYEVRVCKAAPYVTEPLHEIVELFELVSYTATRIEEDQCRLAVSALTRLFQEVENKTKST